MIIQTRKFVIGSSIALVSIGLLAGGVAVADVTAPVAPATSVAPTTPVAPNVAPTVNVAPNVAPTTAPTTTVSPTVAAPVAPVLPLEKKKK